MAAVTAQSKQRSNTHRSHAAARAVVLVSLVLTFVLAGAVSALAIPRDATLARGLAWINARVPYSQTRYYQGYRTDCSGFVSMCWGLSSSYNTRTLYKVSYPISADDLRPGDALLKAGHHVRLFVGWVDEERTHYIAYEETTPGAVQTIKSIDSDLGYGYIPYRYFHIGSSAVPWNAMRNASFDAWSGNNPIHWTASRDASGTVSRRRPDMPTSGLYCLGVMNRTTDPSNVAEVYQSTRIEGGKTYVLSGSGWTDRNPSAFRVRLRMYDAAGQTIVDTSTLGSTAGISATGMRQFSMTQVAPANATSATVSLMLHGGSFIATGTPGTAVFDDVNLYVRSPALIYRFFNHKVGAHFYTVSGVERDGVIAWSWPSYDYEGVAYAVNTQTNTQSLYRFYNRRTGTHFYTASETERDDVIRRLSGTYNYEGVAYGVSKTPAPGAVTVYRFFNTRNGTHFYTASEVERDDVVRRLAHMYRLEGPAFFLAP